MNAFDATRDGSDAQASPGLLDKRYANFGAASVLFFQRPIEMVRAEGCWMEAVDGTRYLDFYNNVPSVGHSHPHVVQAVQRQIGMLNTNTRYLNATVEAYLERLKAKLPGGPWNVLMSCTGSEANDLALRIAMAATGAEGIIVTETAYHGNTLLTTLASPSSYKRGKPPRNIVIVPAPGPEAYGDDIAGNFAAAVKRAITRLKRRGYRPAALLCDSIFSSDGVFADPPGFLADAVATARAAGAMFIADEVQPGFARTGDAFWGFGRHGVDPDFVTTGKPMGNGFPMAATAVHPDLLERFCRNFGYFNTFGGNPVAASAGDAVLDVIENEDLQTNADSVGAHLTGRLRKLADRDARIGAVRGAGLFLGLDLCNGADPDPDLATIVINALRERYVMVGACGKYGHTLKIRPPLCLSRAEADIFADALADTLSALG
ncbi:MAG: aspartate aminotransferase family protein [Pseudomonadota bacterium]